MLPQPELALIFASLLRDLVEDDARTGPKVEALYHPKHWNADAHLAPFDSAIADPNRFTSKPDRQLVMDGEVAFVQENAGLPFDVRRCDD